jgi:hypothetical protein
LTPAEGFENLLRGSQPRQVARKRRRARDSDPVDLIGTR